MATSDLAPSPPNHHADHPGFSGIGGAVAGLSMVIGRGPLSRLTADLTVRDGVEHVVDIGCGPGTATREVARRGPAVTGVDPSAVMLRLAGLLTRDHRGPSWRTGTAEALPVDDASADAVCSVATVHHWRDLDVGLAEVQRVLRPGGRFTAVERRTRPAARGLASHGWTEEHAAAFAARCSAAGFSGVEVSVRRAGRTAYLVVTATRDRTAAQGA